MMAAGSPHFDTNRLVPPFPSSSVTPPAVTNGCIKNIESGSMQLRRPSSFYNPNADQPIYGYAIVQRPYLVPISSSTVYMSCYTTINSNEAHYYVNGNFLAEKLRLEEEEEEVKS